MIRNFQGSEEPQPPLHPPPWPHIIRKGGNHSKFFLVVPQIQTNFHSVVNRDAVIDPKLHQNQEGTTWSKLFRGVTSRQPARQTARFIWDQNYASSLCVVLSARKIWKPIAAMLKSLIFYQQKKWKSYHRDGFFALFQWLCVRTSLKLHIRPRKRVVFLSKKIVTFRFCRPGHYS